jgi:hypothetical protein
VKGKAMAHGIDILRAELARHPRAGFDISRLGGRRMADG